MRPIRVVLGDDHTLVRQGLKALLASSSIRVEGEAGDGRELVKKVRMIRPDIAVVDLSMPLLNGLDATRKIAQVASNTRVIILSMFGDVEYIAQARRMGAWGYVSKEEAPDRLIEAIETVAAGDRYFPPETDEETDNRMDERLTPREREVLQLIAEGKKNSEIAKVMVRSLCTVRNHRARLMRKLGAHSAAELVRTAEEMGLVYISPPKEKNDAS